MTTTTTDKMSDVPRICRTIARYQKHADAILARAEAGEELSPAQLDALACASANVDRHTEWVLDIAARQGIDFVSIDCGTYHLCYSFEESRWEPFVSHRTA